MRARRTCSLSRRPLRRASSGGLFSPANRRRRWSTGQHLEVRFASRFVGASVTRERSARGFSVAAPRRDGRRRLVSGARRRPATAGYTMLRRRVGVCVSRLFRGDARARRVASARMIALNLLQAAPSEAARAKSSLAKRVEKRSVRLEDDPIRAEATGLARLESHFAPEAWLVARHLGRAAPSGMMCKSYVETGEASRTTCRSTLRGSETRITHTYTRILRTRTHSLFVSRAKRPHTHTY